MVTEIARPRCGGAIKNVDHLLRYCPVTREVWAKSASGVVARNASGEILASKTVVHRAVASLFVVEAHVCPQAVYWGNKRDLHQ
ncbi:hypothetical protein GOBAR_DD14338 [Gossypium barbadense]|nr:hypothetical protein GOBAR_DD14338 [Gossypium barbadense]